MFVPFPRTLRAHADDKLIRPLFHGAVVLLLLATWLVWFLAARVTVYARSDRARLEVSQAGNPVDARIAGVIVENHLVLQARVEKGDLLVELDSAIALQRLEEARAKQAALAPQLEARRTEIAANVLHQKAKRDHTKEAIQGARARFDEIEAKRNLAEEQAKRTETLLKTHAVADIDNVRAQSELKEKSAGVQAAKVEISRLERQEESEESETKVRIAQLEKQIADLSSTEAALAASIRALGQEVDARKIRAPVSGRIADLSAKQSGSFVEAGEHLATIIPDGELKAVAEFAPATAIGRIKQGQRARLRFAAFPWMQYGSLAAVVTRVGSEVKDGMVRVELELHPEPGFLVPLQHGLAGDVEIEVEEVTPWTLAIRMAGQAVSGAGPT